MKKVAFFLVLISAVLASRWLFKPGYFPMHDDLQMMRQLQMEKCWQDRQIPCRWVPDMGYGYGYPLFNFYPPLPYYLGQIFRWLGLAFTTTAKLTFALQFFLSGITMFLLATELWGIWGGLLSAVFYVWAPYHSVDVFVRGAMNEAWAFVWFPLIFWAAKKLVESERFNYLVWLALSYALLLLSHNIMVMIFTPLMLLWILFWMIKRSKLPWQKPKLLLQFILSGLWALGLAAFFTLPMFFEKKYTHIETMFSGYFDWRAHFVSLHQLFISRFWGWGPSIWGPNDGMPFPVGHLHWVLALVIFFLVVLKLITDHRPARSAGGSPITDHYLIIGLFFFGLLYAFLTHQRSVFIWQLVKPLQLAQFPWRLLAGVVFCFSLLGGAIWPLLKKRWLILVLILGVIVWNWNYFRPESMGPLPDKEKFSGQAWEVQQTAGIYDYLPKSVPRAPTAPPGGDWQFLTGKVEQVKAQKGTNWFDWQGKVIEPGELQVNIFHFPGWRAWVDRKLAPIKVEKDLGLMRVKLDVGDHQVYFRLTNTPIRAWANLVSLISWWALLLVATKKGWQRWLVAK